MTVFTWVLLGALPPDYYKLKEKHKQNTSRKVK
jgi:hypothetical protein